MLKKKPYGNGIAIRQGNFNTTRLGGVMRRIEVGAVGKRFINTGLEEDRII